MKKLFLVIPTILAALSCTKETGDPDIMLMTEAFSIDYAAQEIEFSYDILNPAGDA